MKKRKVIAIKNLPARLPIWSTLATALALDKWHAPEWLLGAAGLLFLILWISCIHAKATQQEVDLIKQDEA